MSMMLTSCMHVAEPVPQKIDVNVLDKYKGMSAEEIVASLTLEQKAAQMVQGAFYNVSFNDMKEHDYGSVIFPHNINIGAANDPDLTREYGALVGSDIVHTGMILNFSPCVDAAQDPRWGRTYECFSNDNEIIKTLSTAYAEGLLSKGIVVCAKHFLGGGYTKYGTGEYSDNTKRIIDRGDAEMSQAQIDAQLSVYESLVDAGVQSIMVSHSSLMRKKMHENKEYISYLKNDLGFEGFVLSDWDSIENCSGADLKENVIICVNAGLDMLMEADHYEECRKYIVEAVNEGSISEDRINDAVTRIIKVKKNAGLFEDPYIEDFNPKYEFGCDRSHQAAKSFVPLKIGNHMTIEKGMKVYVTGPAATDTGVMCGGWTYFWLGSTDSEAGKRMLPDDHSVLEALEAVSAEKGFEIITDPKKIDECDMVLLLIGEKPYAEWLGDTKDLSIVGDMALTENKNAIEEAKASEKPTTTLIMAGRNVIVNDYIDNWDSCIMCYLPGSEGGNAVADVLTKAVDPAGTLPMPYYSSVDQIGTDECWHEAGWSAAGGR